MPTIDIEFVNDTEYDVKTTFLVNFSNGPAGTVHGACGATVVVRSASTTNDGTVVKAKQTCLTKFDARIAILLSNVACAGTFDFTVPSPLKFLGGLKGKKTSLTLFDSEKAQFCSLQAYWASDFGFPTSYTFSNVSSAVVAKKWACELGTCTQTA